MIRAGKPLDLKDILHHVNIRKPKLMQQLGTQQVFKAWFNCFLINNFLEFVLVMLEGN